MRVMSKKQFKLLLILAAAPHRMTALQIKRAGGYWFQPWHHMPALSGEGWVGWEYGIAYHDGDDVEGPRFYWITEEGRRELAAEISRRAHA